MDYSRKTAIELIIALALSVLSTRDANGRGVVTLENMPIERPGPTPREPQNMCLDKGYDFMSIDELVNEWGYTGRIARRGVELGLIHGPDCYHRPFIIF